MSNGYAENRIIECTKINESLKVYTMLSFESMKSKYETMFIYDGIIGTVARSDKQREIMRLHKQITSLEPHEIIRLELID